MSSTARSWYDGLMKYFAIGQVLGMVGSVVINAPFGRFAPESKFLTFDGRKAWMVMEIVSPVTFLTTFFKAPLSPEGIRPSSSLTHPTSILAGLYLIHYSNRAFISPLRSPSRSRAHISVTLSGLAFNFANGFLLGAYLSSPEGNFQTSTAFSRWTFWVGVVMWAAGFAGNILHDEILSNIRRNQKRKGKQSEGKDSGKKEHYAIPYGYLFHYVSFPNYFCEWIEWTGFALAASPTSFMTPPWLFVMGEVLTMTPRAWRSHQWYHRKFDDYPKERKVVVPFIF